MTAGLFIGAILGVKIAREMGEIFSASEAIKALIVILVTVSGFCTSLFFAYALSPVLVRLSLQAKACLHPKAVHAFQRLNSKTRNLEVELFEVDDQANPSFGINVVVAGFTLGRGWFRPAIFASKTVISNCTEEELHAIFSHEISHLTAWHLFSRLKKALATFFVATFFMSFILLGLQWSGYTKIVTLTSTFAGLVPALLTWLQTKSQMHEQEKEADAMAIEVFEADGRALLSALRQLAHLSERPVAPIVQERMDYLNDHFPAAETFSEAA